MYMGATKIINVLKEDTFDEIHDLFKNASAEEVVFVLPRKGKFLSKEDHFTTLAQSAKETGKTVSVLCSNAQLNTLARKYAFHVLASGIEPRTKKPTKKATLAARIPPQDPYIHDDDRADAYTRDRVVIPSDEIVTHSEEEEGEAQEKLQDGMHIEDLEKEGDQELVPDETEDDDASEKELPAPLDEETAEEIDRADTNESESDAELTIAKSKRRYEQPAPQRNYDDLEKVWQQEEAGTSVWSGIRNLEKKSFFGSIFRKRVPPKFGTRPLPPPRKKSSRHALLALGGGAVIIIGFVVFLSVGHAQIVLKPAQKPIAAQIKIEVSDSIPAVDAVFNKLPGQLFTLEKVVTQEFTATGKKEVAQKARGTVIVYNEYGTTPQTLIATTRFESSTGLVFRTLKTVTVPGTRVENGKISAGAIRVEVIADKPGVTYNVSMGNFTIPAFKEKGDADRYGKFYGKSDAAMQGGASGLASVVTELDYNKARDTMLAKLNSDVGDALKTQTPDLKVLNGTTTAPVVTSTAEIDQAADMFTMNAKATIKTVGFKEADLMQLVKQYIEKTYNLTVLPDRLTLSYPAVVFDDSRSTLSATVAVSGTGFVKVDQNGILTDLLGKTEPEIREYLKNASGIASAKVILSPFWVSKMPRESGRVHMEVTY